MKEYITKNKEIILAIVLIVIFIVLFVYINYLHNSTLKYVKAVDERLELVINSLSQKSVRFAQPVVQHPPQPSFSEPVITQKSEDFSEDELDKLVDEELELFKDTVEVNKEDDE